MIHIHTLANLVQLTFPVMYDVHLYGRYPLDIKFVEDLMSKTAGMPSNIMQTAKSLQGLLGTFCVHTLYII